MAWQLARPDELEELLGFLEHDEWKHVACSSRLFERGKPAFPNPLRLSIFLNRTATGAGALREALLVSRGGLVLPILAGTDQDSSAGTPPRPDVAALIGSRALHSIMGTRNRVDAIQQSIDTPIRAMIDYHLMVLDSARPLPTAPPSADTRRLKIRRARPRDLLTLFPLQREYEKEEVLLDPDRFNASATYLHLQQSLKREIVFFASIDRSAVAKAGTNARGIGYSQIGGVFTVPQMRGRGIARALMNVLLEQLERDHRRVCLFVKPENRAAVRLYERLGFVIRDSFRITYYGG